MVKGIVTNKSAAGLRRSAIAERLRLREEWSTLKGVDENEPPAKVKKKQIRALSKKVTNIEGIKKIQSQKMTNSQSRKDKENSQPQLSSDVLRGIVALVDVGAESRALALRAALSALGATVVPAWSPLVTHLVWSQGGCRDTRARARSLACRVVSPLWVEACAAAARRVSEKVFPSTARDSDLPSPSTLCRLLKTAERENWLVPDLQSDSEDDGKRIRLRISSDTDDNTRNKTSDVETTKESVDVATRVNTAPRRALPASMSPPPANPRSRRKLFTARQDGEDGSEAENTPAVSKPKTRPEKAPKCPNKNPERQKRKEYNLTQQQKKDLKKAERMARRLAVNTEKNRREGTQRRRSNVPRIVLSGMPKSQYQAVFTAVQTLKGIVQRQVNHRTTHVLLGSCREEQTNNNTKTAETSTNKTPEPSKKRLSMNRTCQENQNRSPVNGTRQQNKNIPSENNAIKPFSICNQCNSPEGLVMRMFECDNVEVTDHCSNPTSARDNVTIICSTVNRNTSDVINDDDVICEVANHDISDLCNGIINDKRLRTRKTLVGAARGCRVLHAKWALDSLKEQKWLPHVGYEVTYLLKIAQKARIERSAFQKMHTEYGYNVFRGIRVCVTETADQREAAIELLTLCGAELLDEADVQRNNVENTNAQNGGLTQNGGRTQNGGFTQNGGRTQNGGFTQNSGRTQDGGFTQNGGCNTVVVGKDNEEVCSKWVFDSVAAGRPRTTRRYINKNIVT